MRSLLIVLLLLLPLGAQQPAEVPSLPEAGVPPELGVEPGAGTGGADALGEGSAKPAAPAAPVDEEAGDPRAPIARALVRISATMQPYSFLEPWQRGAVSRRNSLGVALEGGDILTTAGSVQNATFVELQAASGGGRVTAKVVVMDPWLNLALLRPATQAPFLDALQPVALAASLERGDELELWQLELTGQFSKSEGRLNEGVVAPYPHSSGPNFLTGELRMIVQTRPNSLSAPFVREGKLAGLLMGYDSDEQVAQMLPVDIIHAFLNDLADGHYAGRSSLAFDWLGTEDASFRRWLGLPEDLGGVYLNKLRPEGGAAEVGLKEGDVLVAVDDEPVDARGFVQSEHWGRINFSHALLGLHTAGEAVTLTVWRDRQQLELPVTLPRLEPWQRLVPSSLEGRGPNYLILGGMMFQELTVPYLAEASEMESHFGLELTRVLEDPDGWRKEHERVVVLCYSIPTPATFGYEELSHLLVLSANGQPVRKLDDLAAVARATPPSGLIALGLDGEPGMIYLDPRVVSQVNQALSEQGLVPLQRIEPYGPAAKESVLEAADHSTDSELEPASANDAPPRA